MNTRSLFLIALALTTAAGAALAVPIAARSRHDRATAAAQMTKPAPEMEKLKFLQGKWTYDSVYEKGAIYPDGANTKGTYTAIAGPGGFSQISDFDEMAPEGEEIGHEVTNWDAKAGVYHSYVFGNAFPQCVIRTGHWDGDKLIFDYEYEGSGKKFVLRSVTTASADGTVTIAESFKSGDEPFKLMYTLHAKRA